MAEFKFERRFESTDTMKMIHFRMLCLCVVAIAVQNIACADETSLSQYYGFRLIEVFKLSERSSNMLSGDLNHDGLADLVLVDNSKSRLDLLIQRKEAAKVTEKPIGRSDVNSVEDHWRFEHRKLPVDREVSAVALGDFNGDGRTDIAYFGNPDQLVIRFQPEKGEWTEKTQQRVPDVAPTPWFLTAGDLDSNRYIW